MRQLILCEEAAKRREGECLLPMGKRAEDDLDAFVAVVMLVPGGGAGALLA